MNLELYWAPMLKPVRSHVKPTIIFFPDDVERFNEWVDWCRENIAPKANLPWTSSGRIDTSKTRLGSYYGLAPHGHEYVIELVIYHEVGLARLQIKIANFNKQGSEQKNLLRDSFLQFEEDVLRRLDINIESYYQEKSNIVCGPHPGTTRRRTNTTPCDTPTRRIPELTVQQQSLLPILISHMNEKFTTTIISKWYGKKIYPQTLVSLAKHGILKCVDKAPNTYVFIAKDWLEWNQQQDKVCEKFTMHELDDEWAMPYSELCQYLISKYGNVNGSYFIDSNYDTVNTAIKRPADGLYIHHIDENKYIQLTSPEYIRLQQAPFKCQEKEHLVYCNWLEHIVLHYKIFIEYNSRPDKPIITINDETSPVILGLGGIVNYMVPQINDYYLFGTNKEKYIRWDKAVYDNLIKRLETLGLPNLSTSSFALC